MTKKTKAIVLRIVRYGESQLIVDFLTESHGRLSFMVRLSKSSKGKMRRQYFQPLMVLSIEFDFRPQKELQRLLDVGVAIPFSSIPFTPVKLSLAMFLSEVMVYATRCEQVNHALFGFVLRSLAWLDASEGEISNFHILFLMKVSSFLGFAPDLSKDNEHQWFDLKEGCFVSSVPSHHFYLSPSDSLHLIQMARLGYQTMHLYTMNRQQRSHCIEVILEYYKLHVPNFPELKSLPVLKALFD